MGKINKKIKTFFDGDKGGAVSPFIPKKQGPLYLRN